MHLKFLLKNGFRNGTVTTILLKKSAQQVITFTMLAKVIFYKSKTLFSPCSLHHGTTFKGGENNFCLLRKNNFPTMA